MSKNVVIVEAVRTPIGNFMGGLSALKASQLGQLVIEEILQRSKIPTQDVSEVILGQVLTAGDGQNPARQAAINAGISVDVPAWGVSQVCGSGLRAVALGYQSILCGDSDVVIAGGQENMSRSAHVSYIRSGVKMGNAKLVDTMINDGLTDAFSGIHMGITAENIAKKFNISRKEQDEFAVSSQQKAQQAQENGRFDDEIVPVTIKNRNSDIVVSADEFPRHNSTVDLLAKLSPAFDKEGSVTAANSSGINDGAAALLLMSEEKAQQYGLTPMARIVAHAQSAVSPEIMGTGPIGAVKKALSKAGWSIADLDLIESNEAFAAQAIAVNQELGWDENKVNVNGGSIALGHPIGASGARILVTLLHEMQRRSADKALATLCVGGGMGVALCVEKYSISN